MSEDLLKTCQHLLAGNAVFTARHPASGERYTFHFYIPKQGKEKGLVLARLLTGPNNTSSYSRLGVIDPATGNLDLDASIGTGKAGVPVSAALARWLAKLAVAKADVPNGLELVGSGCCLCCHKLLTVPVEDNPYRAYDLGPICGPRIMG